MRTDSRKHVETHMVKDVTSHKTHATHTHNSDTAKQYLRSRTESCLTMSCSDKFGKAVHTQVSNTVREVVAVLSSTIYS